MASRPFQLVPIEQSDAAPASSAPASGFTLVPLDEQPSTPAAPLGITERVNRLIESKPRSPLADSVLNTAPAPRSELAPAPSVPAPTHRTIANRTQMGTGTRPVSALASSIPEPTPLERTRMRMDSALEEVLVTAPRITRSPIPTDRNAPRAALSKPRKATPSWREVLSEISPQIGARIESKIAGVKEYRGEERERQAKKLFWQAEVLPGAVQRAMQAKREGRDYSLWNDPSVQDAVKHLGIRTDQFVRDWPLYANLTPEQIDEIQREARSQIKSGYELRSEGEQRRRMAAQVAQEGRPELDEWSAKALVFDGLTSVPDLLAGVGATVAGGPLTGGVVISGLVAPEFYAEARNRGADHRKAETYATLMTLAEVAPEVPVLELVAHTPAAQKAMRRIVGEAFADSAGGQIVGTAALEGISESITEALQIGINAGVMDEETTLRDALNDIARAGVIGTGIGAGVGAVPALTRRKDGGDIDPTVAAELAEIEEASLDDAELERRIRELETELGEGEQPPTTPAAETTQEQPAAQADTDALDLADLTAIANQDAIAGQIKRAVELGYAKRVAPDRAELTAEGRRRLKELQTGEPVADVEVTLEGEDLRRAGEVPEPRQVDVVPSKENEGWFTILVDGQPHAEVASRESADQLAADLRTKTETEDTRAQQALADEIRRRDEKRSPNKDVPVDVGRPDDLFSQARNQVDIEDLTKQATPEVMYHGGHLQPGRAGAIYYTTDRAMAEHYAKTRGGSVTTHRPDGSKAFDYLNPAHVEAVIAIARKSPKWVDDGPTSAVDDAAGIRAGKWSTLEQDHIVDAIKKAGFNGFWTSEAGARNLALFAEPAPQRKEPTEAQKEAGNYPKRHVRAQGLEISIENEVGSVRTFTRPDGTKGERIMKDPYGYFRRTEDNTGEQVDVFLGPNPDAPTVYVIDQVIDGKFDEPKVMFGYNSEEEARQAYLRNYQRGWKGLGAITGLPLDEFKQWLKSTGPRKPLAWEDGKEQFVDASKLKAPKQEPDQDVSYADQELTLEKVQDFHKRLRAGEVSLDEYKATFDALKKNRAALIDELEKLSKEELVNIHKDYRGRNEKKDWNVRAAYDDLVERFALHKTLSFTLVGDYQRALDDAITKIVESVTQEDLDAFAAREKKLREEHEAMLARMDDPQTLADFRMFIRRRPESELTDEQLERYDALVAEESKEKRQAEKARREADRTRVESAGRTVGSKVIESTHTKHGYPIFVVQLDERVDRDVYDKLNKAAKQLGGYYSSYRGRGAIPGFTFKERDKAEAFAQLAQTGDTSAASEVVKERREAFEDDKAQTTVERLRAMAERLEESAQERLNQDRKTNTERRARMAARAEAVAREDLQLARTMRNIAEAIDKGEVEFLDNVRTKAQVDMLLSMLETAKREEIIADSKAKHGEWRYQDQIERAGEAPTRRTVRFVKYPRYSIRRGDLAQLGRALLQVPGAKQLGQSILRSADDVTDKYTAWVKNNLLQVALTKSDGNLALFPSKQAAERARLRSPGHQKMVTVSLGRGKNYVVLSPREAQARGLWEGDESKTFNLAEETALEVIDKVKKHNESANWLNRIHLPWTFEDAKEKRARLKAMGIDNPSLLRQALRELIGLMDEKPKADPIKQKMRELVGRRDIGIDFFPTPKGVAENLVARADIQPGMLVLEPSAGYGAIADEVRALGVEPDVVEMSSTLREILELKGYNIVGTDFMELQKQYDRIVMNPPFSNGMDIDHVRHAYDLLKPGGRIVAIMGQGAFHRSDKKATEFRAWADSIGAIDEELPEGTFLDPSLPVTTGANARVIVIDKPSSGKAPQLSVGLQSTAPFFEKHRTKIEAAVRARLKSVKNAPPVHVLRRITDVPQDVKNRYDIASIEQSRTRYIEGMMDWQRGEVYLFSDALSSQARAGWVLFHELAGHHGIRRAAEQLGINVEKIRDRVLDNPFVKQLADEIGKQRKITDPLRAADEALAEIAAAVRTGDYKHIQDRYGIEVPQAQRKTLRGLIARLVQAIKLALARRFGVRTDEFSDADVYELIERAWKAAQTPPARSATRPQRQPVVLSESPAPVFYSAVLRAAEGIKLEKGTAEQWLGTLRNRPGVKQEELDWIGLEDWLKSLGRSATKQEVVDFIRANQIQVQETLKGAPVARSDTRELLARHDNLVVELTAEGFYPDRYDGTPLVMLESADGRDRWELENREVTNIETGERATARVSRLAMELREIRSQLTEHDLEDDISRDATRYEHLTMAGGQRYRELLLTIPGESRPAMSFEEWADARGIDLSNADDVEALRDSYRRDARHFESGNVFHSSHWNEPNILAHVRFDERVDQEGKRVLFIEEIQSDWHQEGRRKGYRPTDTSGWTARPGTMRPDLYEVFDAEGRSVALSTVTVNQSPYGPTPEQAQRKAIEDVAKRGLPNAPFKTTWPELAFKRMLRWAAENGFDRIAWTTGVQQVARYPAQIRQVVDRITWETERYLDGSSNVVVRGEKGGKRTFQAIVRKDGYVLDGQPREFIGEQLEDVLGKYMASFILRGEESGAIEGQDLTIGGEGMRGFYDDILPKTASKLTKKWGGKVGKTTISTGSSSEVVHSLDITPAMREAALGGLPLFSEAQDPRRARLERLRALRAQRLGMTPGAAHVPLFQAGQPMPAQAMSVTIGTGATARTIPIPNKPIRREHIMALLQREFDVRIYQGKPFRGRMLGFFRPSNFEVRIKHKNDLEVTAHEVFHWLDRTYPEVRKLYHEKRFRQELKSISYDAKKLHEGFAEFGRLFLTQDAEAINRVPQFYAAFTQTAKAIGIYDKLVKIQDRMHQWYAQGALARARSKIGTEAEPLAQRMSMLADQWAERAAAESVDWLHAAKVIERELTGTIAADAMDSPYKSLRLLAGARNTIESFLNFGTLDWTPQGLEFTGKSLKHVFEPVAHVMDDALSYFVGRRAQELMKYGKEHLFTKDEIEALLAAGQNSPYAKDIEKAFDEYQAYNKRLLDFAQHSGVISSETRNTWEELYQNYVPFYRVSEMLGATRFTGPSIGTPFKRLFGGTANLNDIWDNMVLNTATIVHASLRNMAKRQLFSTIEKSPLGQRFAVRIPTSTDAVKVVMTQVEEVLRTMIAEAQQRALNPNATAAEKAHYAQVAQALDILTGTISSTGGSELFNLQEQATFFVGGQPPKIPDKDSVLVKGQRVWYQIADPLLWDMLVDINYHKPIGLLETVFGAFKRGLTRGVTLTLEFQIANLFRDTLNAFTMSKGGQIPFVDNLRATYNILRESEDYKLFLANGGGFGNATPVNEGRRVRLRMNKLIGPNRKVNIRAILDTPARLLEAWDKWGQSYELATRVAEFRRMRQKGFSLREAAFEGREISSDFAMHGRSGVMRAAMTSLPFFNARVQGLYRIERELFERSGGQSWRGDRQVRYAMRGFLGITMPALLLYFRNKDDEDYQALPEETKDLYYPIKIPDSHDFLLIPKPFETGALFATVPERIWQYYETRNEKKLMDAAQFMVTQTFAFDPVPQVGRPVFEWYANKDWRGLPIVPRGLENVEPREQYRWNTSESLVKVGRAFDVSPIALDHFLRGYFGGVGSYLTMASDSLVSSGRYGEHPERRLQDYPVLRRFIRQSPYTTTSYERDFWELKNEIDKTVNTARKIRAEFRADDLEHYLGDTEKQVLFGLSGVANDVAERAREIATMQILIRRDPTLSGEEKRRQIDQLQREVNELFRQVVNELSDEQLERYRDALEGKQPQARASDRIRELDALVRDKPRRQQIAALRSAGYTHTASLVASLPPIPDREALDFFASEMGDLNQ